jgi:hypothetical protein
MFLIGPVAALVALLPALAETPMVKPPPAPALNEAPAVRVVHELVGASVLIERPIEPVERRAAARRAPAAPSRHTQQPGFVARARQVLLGDGRHRPQPFPRVGQ